MNTKRGSAWINFPHIVITMSARGECCEIGYYSQHSKSKREVKKNSVCYMHMHELLNLSGV